MSLYHTEVTNCTIDGYNVTDDEFIRGEVWRTVNAVGRWKVILDNSGGTYNNAFDVHDAFQLDITGNTVIQGRVDGPGVTLQLVDAEDDFKEFIIIQGVDQMQDLLFHDNFTYPYTLTTRTIVWILDDVINNQIGYGVGIGQTNIIYADPGGTPAVGVVEFREGSSFLGTIQDMHRRVNYLFYVDDTLNLMNGTPGFAASAQFIRCVEGAANNNVLRRIDWNRRAGDKLYNYVRLYGKNPQFDAYTEYNSAAWTAFPVPANPTDDAATVRVGNYSLRVTNTAPPGAGSLRLTLTCPVYNYASWDFTKGRIGTWLFFDDPGGAYGTPQRMALNCRLTDVGGSQIDYFEGQGGAGATPGKTRVWLDEWGYCEFPLGEDIDYTGAVNTSGEWCSVLGATFDWAQVTEMDFQLPRPGIARPEPGNMYLDGLTIPVPPVAIAQNVASQAAYRWRPLPLALSYVRTQNALQDIADDLLAHHKDTDIDYLKLMVEGNTSLRYAGQSVTVNIPDLGITNDIYYMESIHHVVEPRVDVSGGFGYDYITEVEMIPIVVGVTAYDARRLSRQPVVSSYNLASEVGTGVRMK